MKLNTIETLKYILNYVDNPQDTGKKRLLAHKENKIRREFLEQIEDFITECKKEVDVKIKAYNKILLEKNREMIKVKPELKQEKLQEDKDVKAAFEEMVQVKKEVGEKNLDITFSDDCFNLCHGLVKDWDEKVGWEAGEDEVADDLLKLFKVYEKKTGQTDEPATAGV